MRVREPETQEDFDDSFKIDGMDAQQVAAKLDDTIGELRIAAGDFVRSLFLKHGYFNGNLQGEVTHGDAVVTVCLTVFCYGLPYRIFEADPPTADRAFIEGAEWWGAERDEAEAEAVKRYGNGAVK